jgi:predicted transposase/invertase (TIGR01784 family)
MTVRLDNYLGRYYKIFEKVMSIAELLKLEKTDRRAYEESLKKHRDLKNAMDTQYMLGLEEGMDKGIEIGLENRIEKGIEKAADMMLKAGTEPADVSRILELSIDEVEVLSDNIK